jgi:hypothetical protein
MSADRDGNSARADARDNRRWLIGVGISVAFGLFGVVMALLSYADRSRPSLGPATNAAAKRGSEPARPRERSRSTRHEAAQSGNSRP